MNKIKIFLSLITLFLITYVFAVVRVSKSLNNDDIKISKLLDVSKECSNLNSYKKELLCIKNIQKAQLNLIKGKKCRSKYFNIGSINVLTENTACCWDRSRITEQTLIDYVLKVRHIHLLHTENLGYFSHFFRGKDSHAATEVLTVRGWLGVDSNESFF